MITGKEDAANLYARGRYSVGGKIIDDVMNELRKISDKCNSVTCFILFHSFGGGTGSGLTSLLINQLTDLYGKTTKLQFVVYPSPRVCKKFTSYLILELQIISLIGVLHWIKNNRILSEE